MLLKSKIYNPVTLLLTSGLAFFLAQLAPLFWWTTLAGFVLFILGVRQLNNWRSALLAGWLVGTLKCLGGSAWIWSAFPLVWLGLDSINLQFLLMGTYWTITSLSLGLGMIVPALIAYRFRDNLYVFLPAFPVAWVVGEVLGSFVVSLWFLGPGGYPNLYTAHGYAGLPLAQFKVFYPAMAAAGLYGLSYTAAIIGSLLALVITRQRFADVSLVAVVATYLILIIVFPMRTAEPLNLEVVAIDTTFTSSSQQHPSGRAMKKREVESAVRTTLQANGGSPDILLLPEDSRLTNLFDTPERAMAYLKALAPEAKTVVVDSARTDLGNGQVALRAYYYDLGANEVYMTDKQFLVPQGEYITHSFRLLLGLLGQDEVIARTDKNQNYVPGPVKGYENFPANVPAMIFCLDSSSVLGVRLIKRKHDTPLVLHPVSHSWFREPTILRYQLDLMLKTQAVWNDVTIVTAANMYESKVFLSNGKIKEVEEVLRGEYWRAVEYNF